MTQKPRAFQYLDWDYGSDDINAESHETWDEGVLHKGLSWHGSVLDRLAKRVIEKIFLAGDEVDVNSNLEEIIEYLKGEYPTPGSFQPHQEYFSASEDPADFRVSQLREFGRGEHLKMSFKSQYKPHSSEYREEYSEHEGNEICFTRLWKHHDTSCPTVICIHYWCGGTLWMDERVFGAPQLYKEGFNVAFITLPFHGRRTPDRAYFPGQLFPSQDLRRTNEAFGQSIADVLTYMDWLRDLGLTSPIGAMGISLGGYVTALLASLTDRLSFAIPIIAPASFADVLWRLGSGHSRREQVKSAGFTLQDFRDLWSVHCPLHYDLKLPRDRVMLVPATGDRIVRPAQSLALWHHWNEPEIHWFSGSHLAHYGRLDYMDKIRKWMADLEIK